MRALILVGLAGVASLVHGSFTATQPKARDVTVVGLDYTFQVPRELPAGRTVFHFRNAGKVRHELNIFMLKPGVTIQQVLELRKQNKPTQDLVEGGVGVLIADSGSRSGGSLSTDLVAGRDYGVICIFRDNATAPRHYEMGMYSVIHVRRSGKAPLPAPRSDTVVGLDYAFRYPATLSPGRHTFAFDNRGKVRHEMVVILLKKGITMDSMLKVARNNGDPRLLIDVLPGLLTAPAGRQSLGRLEVDLLPGREYTLVCFYTDSVKAPPHVALGMYGGIRVTGPPGS